MKTPKHSRAYTIIGSLIVFTLLGAYYVVYVKNAFDSFDRKVDSKIESWTDYKPTNINLGQGICEDKQFGTLLEMINAEPRAALHLDGDLTLIATENPLRLRNSEFRDYYYFVLSKCRTTEGFIPVRAYRDKLLWKNECSSFLQKTIASPCGAIQKSIEEWEKDNAISSNEHFNEAGINFQSPQGYHIALTSHRSDGFYRFSLYPDGSLWGNKISNSGATLFIPLEKDLAIPTLETELGINLTDFDSEKAALVMIGGRGGKRIIEPIHGDSSDYPQDGELIMEMYPVPYSNAPIILRYYHPHNDDLMEPYMKMLHDSWKFDY